VGVRTLQSLLVLAAIGWALIPGWGGPAFLAVYGLVLLTIATKRLAARRKLTAHLDELAKAVSPEGIAWAKDHPLFYVWPDAARAWGLTLKIGSLLMLVLSAWFVVRGVFFLAPGVWLWILPAGVVFVVGVTLGGRLDLDALLAEEKWKRHKPLHDEVKKVLTLQALAGKWSPGVPDGLPPKDA
jgi:hypothetical protein